MTYLLQEKRMAKVFQDVARHRGIPLVVDSFPQVPRDHVTINVISKTIIVASFHVGKCHFMREIDSRSMNSGP